MANIFNYIDKYKDISFKEKEFNDVDNLVFCSLSYLNFSKEFSYNNKGTINYIGNLFLSNNKYKEVSKYGIPQKDGYKVLEKIVNSKRYKNAIISDYIHDTNKDMQFSAMTFNISKKLKFICFEGTDELISGWKEDCHLACFFPVPSHTKAIDYVNNHTHIFGADVIIGGHSKGGNLALVSAMYLKKYKQHKLKRVYSNDGPGLRKKEFESLEYQNVKDKYIHFVPETSVVGVLLRNDKYNVIKTSKKYIFSHAMATWKMDDDKLVEGELSKNSLKLEKNIIEWLDNHNDKERITMINNIFKVIEDNNIDSTMELKKISNVIKLISKIKGVDKQTKDLATNLIKFSYTNMLDKKYMEKETS